MLSRLTIPCVAGSSAVADSQLAYVSIHWVSRGDLHYRVRVADMAVDTVPNELEVVYYPFTSTLEFRHSFNEGEKINIVYEV